MVLTSPEIPLDFAELLAEFDDASVRHFGRTCEALVRFGAPTTVVTDLRSALRNEIVWLGNPPLRIDLLQEAAGIEFQDAWQRRTSDEWKGTPVQIISREDLNVTTL